MDSLFGLSLYNLVQSKLLFLVGRTAEEEFGRQPPVGNVYSFFGVLERDRDSPEVVSTINIPVKLVFSARVRPIDIPLHTVAGAHREVRFVAVLLANSGALLVATLFVLFIVSMVSIELKSLCKLQGSRKQFGRTIATMRHE